jgi:hypothetical protein
MRKILELLTTNWKNEQLIKNMRDYAKKEEIKQQKSKIQNTSRDTSKNKSS